MKVFNGYSGSGIFLETAKEMGHTGDTCDANPDFKPTILADMLTIDPAWIAENYDCVQLSPMCTTMSLAGGNTHWDIDRNPKTTNAVIGKAHILHCLKILNECVKRNVPCFVENPNGRIIWFMPDEYKNQITYCSYGEEMMKLTNIYTNCGSWIPKPKCHNGNKDCHHQPAPRGSKTGTQGRKNNYLRSILPKELCKDWMESAEKHYQEVRKVRKR